MSFSKLDTIEDLQEMIPNNIENWELNIAEPELLDLYQIKRHSTKIILDGNNNFVKEYGYGKGNPEHWQADLSELN